MSVSVSGLLFVILFCTESGNGFPTTENANNAYLSKPSSSATNLDLTPPEIIKFMKRFGYLDSPPLNSDFPDAEAIYQQAAISEAVKNIQKYGNLNQTGVLDNATLKLMSSPRCGVPDIPRSSTERTSDAQRHKRYVMGAQRWQKRNIKYFIANWSPKVEQEHVERDMKKVFDIWASYSNLRFKRIYDMSADIIIAFGATFHGDNYPFDGPGNILAHAFYPYEMQHYGGDIHFDNDENWKENSTNLADGVDFFTVALHEMGHSLGLAHSHVYSSIMFPYYKGPTHAVLDYDDIIAMYNMYIMGTFIDDHVATEVDPDIAIKTTKRPIRTTLKPALVTTERLPTSTAEFKPTYEGDYETVDAHRKRYDVVATSTVSPDGGQTAITGAPKPIPSICDGNFDAVGVFNGSPYIFKGNYVWKLTDTYKIVVGYPIQIHQMFPFLPNDVEKIDAAYERSSDNAIILFIGNHYWTFDGQQLRANNPRPLTDYGIPENITAINAAMYWPKNKKTYLFGSTEFWRFDDTLQTLDNDYPMNMSRWVGIPNDIDAAVTIPNGKTYFFKEGIYWLYNNMRIRPEPGYPKRSSYAWLGCPLPQRRPYRNNAGKY